ATANNLGSIQPPLRDRMEVIEISGYTSEEKVEIAVRHLLPKQLEAHGLKKKDLSLSREALQAIINGYTRESGVRGLEKSIAKVVRYAAKNIAMERDYEHKVEKEHQEKILG